jgi:luciferase family oxidoreductase group 1
MRLSVLDQSPISAGSSGPEALANTLDLARLADELGYHRYWVAEHHGGPMLAGPAPEVLIGPIAAATERIRVGSGGVMLPHYSPFKVAESFSLLSGLYPGRIDLGVGRASGTDPLTAYALQRDRRQASPDDFPEQLAELLAHLEDDLPEDHPFARLSRSLPAAPRRPSRGCLDPRRRARSGPPSSASPTRSPTSSTATARRSRPTTSAASTPACASRRRAPPSRPGRSRPTRRRRPGA